MKKFRYKLDPLLKIREFREKQEFTNYGRMLGEINKHSEKIRETIQLKAEFTNFQRKKMMEGYFNLSEKSLAQDYYNKLSKVKVHAENEIASRKEETERLRKLAEKARQQRKILEILKEKKFSDYQLELGKWEYKELDEFNQRKRKAE